MKPKIPKKIYIVKSTWPPKKAAVKKDVKSNTLAKKVVG